MPPQNWIILIFLTLSRLSFAISTIWTGLFFDTDLTFLYTPTCRKVMDLETDFQYFHDVLDNNPYSPRRNAILCQSTSRRFCFYPAPVRVSFKAYSNRDREKSARSQAIFVQFVRHQINPAAIGNLNECRNLIYILTSTIRPHYIFGQIDRHRYLSDFTIITSTIVTTKLILFEESAPTSLLIPCLTCNQFSGAPLDGISLPEIRQAWDAQNRDMHNYMGILNLQSLNATCGLAHKGFANLQFPDFCPIAVIANKYNLTLIGNVDYSWYIKLGRHGYGNVFYLSDNDTGPAYTVYEVILDEINFVTVTDYPAVASGVESFVSPFDRSTWTFTLMSVLLVGGFFTWLGLREGFRDSSIPLIATIAVDRLIVVTSIFLGQVGDSSGKSYRSGTAALMLVVIWLFGNLVLMANVYQGSIYSCLAVFYPTQTPTGVTDLLNWDVPILEMFAYYNLKTGVTKSILLDFIIPELIATGEASPKFVQFLNKFKAKVLLGSDPSVQTMASNMITGNGTQKQMLVVMFSNNDKEFFVNRIRIVWDRYIVRNKGGSPFSMTRFLLGNTNLLSPYVAKEFGRMRDTGLNGMWNRVLTISKSLRNTGDYTRDQYFQLVQSCFGNQREPVTFHESMPVSLELIKPIFAICAVLVGMEIVVFVVENRRNVVDRMSWSYWYIKYHSGC